MELSSASRGSFQFGYRLGRARRLLWPEAMPLWSRRRRAVFIFELVIEEHCVIEDGHTVAQDVLRRDNVWQRRPANSRIVEPGRRNCHAFLPAVDPDLTHVLLGGTLPSR